MFIRHILVATDFSDRSRAALRYAIGLTRELEAGIDVLHVIDPPRKTELIVDAYLGRPMPKIDPGLVADAERKIKQFTDSVPHEGLEIGRLVEPGDPAATIVRMATELPADLIVIGTHARTGVSELVLGSVAHRVLTVAPCPVVTLRGDEAVRPARV
jgi:universal stress protein A